MLAVLARLMFFICTVQLQTAEFSRRLGTEAEHLRRMQLLMLQCNRRPSMGLKMTNDKSQRHRHRLT